MFGDRSPAAAGHYLVITKEHICESSRSFLYASYWVRLFTASICSLDRSRVDVGELQRRDTFHPDSSNSPVKGLKEVGELYFVRQNISKEKWKCVRPATDEIK